MIHARLRGKRSCRPKMLSIVALLVLFSTGATGANHVTGSVRNQSRGEPAAGDEVILIRLGNGMSEEARAKTDAQGAFTLNVQRPDKPHLVRVFHQSVSYDQQVSAGQARSIKVFDAATQVQGITGAIEILRTAINGDLLHVSDLVEIKNISSPPLTQVGEHTFEVYLPASAKIDSVMAAGPDDTGMMISVTPVPGQPGHYTVNFPLRRFPNKAYVSVAAVGGYDSAGHEILLALACLRDPGNRQQPLSGPHREPSKGWGRSGV